MSERILKALMQLFAIIARPESNSSDRKAVVESFLKQQLNQELVSEYLEVFDKYYEVYQKKQTAKAKRKTIALSSVKVLKICAAINEELLQAQKIVVLIRLLEFIKSDISEITDQEFEFVETVASSFNVPEREYTQMRTFVLNPIDQIPFTSDILVIDDNKEFPLPSVKHIYKDSIRGQIRVLNIVSTNMYVMRFLGVGELYLNGQLLQPERVHVLSVGSSIRNSIIKPIYYGDIVSTFNIDKIKSRVVFEAKHITFRFPEGKVGLHDINFCEESGKLIGIMGASGAGKSTLLNVFNGSAAPAEGEVLINGFNIHTESEEIEGLIGHVSQDDLLIEELTVFQNLYYNAKLCFDNYTEEKIVETVNKMLQNLGLYEIRHMKVGSPLNKKISGGQRKRLNIALELIREPAVLFLDEPTSGLSSRDSENIMDLLKELALKGKLVFVVIHQPSSDIFKMFDRLIILDTGGYLIYNGDPVDSIIYFKSRMQQADWNDSECPTCGNVNPEQVFNIVESQVLDEYGNLTPTRKISPKEWHAFYQDYLKEHEPKQFKTTDELPEISFKIPNRFKQFIVFTKRDVLSKLTNTQYLVINLFEAPVLAILLSYIIKYWDVSVGRNEGYVFSENNNLPVYLFMAVIIAIFIGLTVSAEEIISDRKILKRESFLHLSRSSYLFSKVAILITLSAIQAATFVLIGNSIIEIKGMYFHYWLILFSTWVFANMLGLNISDTFKTSVTIYILIPFLVIPQIILSGIIVKFDNLNPKISSPVSIPWYGEIMTARWAYEALAVHQFKNNKYEENFYTYDKIISQARYKKDFWITTLNNKVNNIQKELGNPEKKEKVIKDLEVLRNELREEQNEHNVYKYDHIDKLYVDEVTAGLLEDLKVYFDKLRKYYVKLANKAFDARDRKISAMQQTPEERKAFLELKKDYDNEGLNDLVRNSGVVRIMEYEGRLYRKSDPVFSDPVNTSFVKAHFYAPKKPLFGRLYDTYYINLIVIWVMSIILYITLYYKTLKGTIELSHKINTKLFKKVDKE